MDHRKALGPGYVVHESDTALLLSTRAERRRCRARLHGQDPAADRPRVDGVAQPPEWGKDIIAHGTTRTATTATSPTTTPTASSRRAAAQNSMPGCGHFVTFKAQDLRAIEPVIVHADDARLRRPSADSGLAQRRPGGEHRAAAQPASDAALTPPHGHGKHRCFWNDEAVQQFWSGKSFLRKLTDGAMLSYDLALILVAQLSADWPAFRTFALAANIEDSLSAAAREQSDRVGAAFGVLLGARARTRAGAQSGGLARGA